MNRRTLWISALACALGILSTLIAKALLELIQLFTNLSYYGKFSFAAASPADHHLGAWAILIPVLGGLAVGLMARYGAKAIRGHGIPEAMEQILVNESRIPARLTWLKPLSTAISIGSGGPFGAEGPIIATGAAVGSQFGQRIRMSADERKTLLAAGAAAGMTAIFNSPLSAVLLAIELLLFEFRPVSFIPVAFAATAAAISRVPFLGSLPPFLMQELPIAMPGANLFYVLEGTLLGLTAVGITRVLYRIEDGFEELPIHWMFWPALGAIAVGVIGWFDPKTLGVGYDNIEAILSGKLVGTALLIFTALKLGSWLIALGSGTAGGTLAPLFTIGGGLGSVLAYAVVAIAPGAGIDLRTAALVGMASTFGGASRAYLASMVFAVETTGQLHAMLPLIGAMSGAYVSSALLMKNTIMTEKLARRGLPVPHEYFAMPPTAD